MRENGDKIELEGLLDRIKGYIFAPACLKKLQFKAFLNWNALVGLWTFYTRLYAVHISSYKIIGNDLKFFLSNSRMRTFNYDPNKDDNFHEIHKNFNGSEYESNEDMFSKTGLNQTEIRDVQKDYLYKEGLSTASQLMMLYPLANFSVRNFSK